MFGPELSKTLRVIFFVMAVALVAVQITFYAFNRQGSEPGLLLVPAVPLVSAGMALAALTTPGTAVVALALGCACVWAAGCASAPNLMAAFMTGSIGAYSVNPLRQRGDLLRCGGLVVLTFAVLGIGSAATYMPVSSEILKVGLWGAIGGVGAVALFWLLVAVFERTFDIVSDWGLLELCSPEHPLLHDLTITAPGTWAHSVMVGNLAESAAKQIGANALLVRTQAYFHDIGKTKRPEFFIENQGAINIHDKMSPNLSAVVIASHVKDGLDMAEEHGLPQIVRDAIAQHHGTTLIRFFYEQATAGYEQEDPVLKEHFRYEGPKPQTKEVGILMLADIVEAATRSVEKMSPARFENLVGNLVRERLEDGQLDECDLTFKDIRKIVQAFVQTLTAVRHNRIDYGAITEEEGESVGASVPDQPVPVSTKFANN